MTQAPFDLATLPATPASRRTALVVGILLGALSLAALPVATVFVGGNPAVVGLMVGLTLMAFIVTVAILVRQYALVPRRSTTAVTAGFLFVLTLYLPYLATFPTLLGGLFGAPPDVATLIWAIWHTALPLSLALYAGWRSPDEEVPPPAPRGAVLRLLAATVGSGAACAAAIYAVRANVPPLVANGRYGPPLYVVFGLTALLASVALYLLARRRFATVLDTWLGLAAAAALFEVVVNASGATRFTIGWYLGRLDVLVAAVAVVLALLGEIERLGRVATVAQRRLRATIESVQDALITADAAGTVTWMNPSAERLFGFGVTRREAGLALATLIPEFDELRGTTGIVETRAVRRDGSTFTVEIAPGVLGPEGVSLVVARDVTARREAEEATRRARDQALAAAETKARFLATASHELRTPIHAVVGMTELMEQTELPPEAREHARIVRESAISLRALVDDVLDVSALESGKGSTLDEVSFSPATLVEAIVDVAAPQAFNTGLAIGSYVDEAVPALVLGDESRMRHVLQNIVGNAVKYTARGHVLVRVGATRRSPQQIELRIGVEDTGLGIPAAQRDRLFEPFVRGDRDVNAGIPGTGLGLAITVGHIRAMGGRIQVGDTPGGGTTFTVAIPLTRLDAKPQTPPMLPPGTRVHVAVRAPSVRSVVERYVRAAGIFLVPVADATLAIADLAGLETLPAELPRVALLPIDAETDRPDAAAYVRLPLRRDALWTALAGAAFAPRGTPDLPVSRRAPIDVLGGRVLIAEDNPVNRKLALAQLARLGVDAVAVADGAEAVRAAEDAPFDLVLMDCQMPVLDGFAATVEIRRAETATGRHVPIVAMTANAMAGDRDACLAAGMDDYLAKPVQLDDLRRVLARWVPRSAPA